MSQTRSGGQWPHVPHVFSTSAKSAANLAARFCIKGTLGHVSEQPFRKGLKFVRMVSFQGWFACTLRVSRMCDEFQLQSVWTDSCRCAMMCSLAGSTIRPTENISVLVADLQDSSVRVYLCGSESPWCLPARAFLCLCASCLSVAND